MVMANIKLILNILSIELLENRKNLKSTCNMSSINKLMLAA